MNTNKCGETMRIERLINSETDSNTSNPENNKPEEEHVDTVLCQKKGDH
jgi:hypothetical protein